MFPCRENLIRVRSIESQRDLEAFYYGIVVEGLPQEGDSAGALQAAVFAALQRQL